MLAQLTALVQRYNTGPTEDLVENVANRCRNHTNIVHDKRNAIEFRSKCSIALAKDNDGTQNESEESIEWKPQRVVRQLLGIATLALVGATEAQVDENNTPPTDKTSDGCDAQEPLETDRCTINGDKNTGEADDGGEQDSAVGSDKA